MTVLHNRMCLSLVPEYTTLPVAIIYTITIADEGIRDTLKHMPRARMRECTVAQLNH